MQRFLKILILINGILLRGVSQNISEVITLDSTINPIQKPGWELVFNDEFEDSSLNGAVWWPQEGIHADELQYYTPRQENVFLKNGYLYLRAIQENFKNSLPYTSGEVFSAVEYGKGHLIEVRCKIPKGKGLWPAFWFWSGRNKNYQELDVFEYWSYNTRRFCVTNHSWDSLKQKRISEFKWIKPRTAEGARIDLSEYFMTYATYWDDNGVKIMLNNVLVAHFKNNIPPQPFPIILNLAVYRDSKNKPYDTNIFPADFIIDYVRVYKRIGAKTITR